MRNFLILFSVFAFGGGAAQAFCGFYVARADGALYNEGSKVVYARDGDQSTITMSSDYRGEATDFALIIPTPKVLREDQIRTVEAATVDHLDAFSAPRLVEYFDEDPCNIRRYELHDNLMSLSSVEKNERRDTAAALGVEIAGEYAIGTYDVLILEASQSDGLITFLTVEGYSLPEGAEPVLKNYIAMGMKFFVARVNLERHEVSETRDLPPLQISFSSPDFMLPIQLGKVNADGPQDALIMMLTRQGRVEVANYSTTTLPTNTDVPLFVEDRFADFYRSMFHKALPDGGIALEYGWDMSWCDPCAAEPLSAEELTELGVTWLGSDGNPGQAVYVTRFHAQYTKDQMPDDLMFHETDNRGNYQGRYVMNHPFDGKITCLSGSLYVVKTRIRLKAETQRLAQLTGWDLGKIEEWARASLPKRYW